MDTKTKIPKQTVGGRISRAYEQLYALIVHGRLPPGARIAEGPLAETLGVSRTPVREALQRLKQEGLLIEVGGGSGLRGRLAVAPLQRERMEELYALVAAIEALAARGLSKVAAPQREQLARRLETIERAFHAEARRRSPEYDRLYEHHQAFHRALVEAAAGPETLAVLRTIRPQLDRYEWFYAPMAGPDFTPTRNEHAAIVQAVRRGNAQELERAVRTNWLNAAQRLGPLIERFDGRLPGRSPLFSISRSMKLTIAVLAVFISACAGCTTESTEPSIASDSCAVARPQFSAATAAERSLFAYNVNAPLNLQKTVESTSNGVEVSAISFDSPDGGRATGMLFNPVTRSSLRPGIVLMHGMPGNARQLVGYGTGLAQDGAVVIAIDAPFARRGGQPVQFTSQDRAEQIQLIKDLQRAVDVLRAMPNVDKERIAYHGTSYGGAMGALFAGIERRIKTAVLVVPDGGLVSHFTGPEDLNFMNSLPCATRAAWFRAMTPIEPIRFIGHAPPVTLLVQSGRSDTLVPAADADALHKAVPQPTTIRWYDAGHSLNQQAFLDRLDWLTEKIGLDAGAGR